MVSLAVDLEGDQGALIAWLVDILAKVFFAVGFLLQKLGLMGLEEDVKKMERQQRIE